MTTAAALAVEERLMPRMRPYRLGERLRELRTAKGLSQQAVADAIGKTLAGYNHIENNRTSLPGNVTLHALAEVLETTTLDLLHAAGYVDSPALLEGVDVRLVTAARGAPKRLVNAAISVLRAKELG